MQKNEPNSEEGSDKTCPFQGQIEAAVVFSETCACACVRVRAAIEMH